MWNGRCHLDSYHPRDQKALAFSSREEFLKAGKLLYGDLMACPFDLIGHLTIVVPAEAVSFFQGLSFKLQNVISREELTSEEIRELRRTQGHH